MTVFCVRSVLFAFVLLIAFGTHSRSEGLDWIAEVYDDNVIMSYLLKHDAGEKLSIECDKKSGVIEVAPNVMIKGLEKYDSTFMTFSGPSGRIDLQAEVRYTHNGYASVVGKTTKYYELVAVISKPGSLKIELQGENLIVPIGPQALSALATFRKHCPILRPRF